MEIYYYVIIVLVLILLFRNKKRILTVLKIKRKRRGIKMTSVIEKFIGKDCYINLGSGGSADGVVKSVADGWLEIESKDGQIQAVNVDYISRIREYPRNKKGKRKTIFE